MPTLNWRYGAKTPDVEQAVSDAIFAAHRYRNRLCELELQKRERHYALLRELAPAFVECEASVAAQEIELGKLREQIQAERARQRTKTPQGIGGLIKQAAECKTKLKELRAKLKQAKLDAYSDPAVKQAMSANASQHKAECAEAKANSGLYWGTEAIVKQACSSFASGAPPRFRRYEGEGQLAVQLQGGLDCDHAERYNTLCYIGNELGGNRRECYIRIGSDAGSPVFACVPIVFHRPLPAGKIKWAYLERRKIADHVRWTIRLTIDVVRESRQALPGEVAIHTGWRMENGALRVATVLGSDGRLTVLRLPKWHCEQYLELDAIRSRRDEAFNVVKAVLIDWLRGRDVPDWLADARQYLHQWGSQARLAALWWHWSENRIAGDDDVFRIINDWRKKDKRDWQHARRLSVRIVRRRKDLYRKFAHSLSQTYGVVVVSPIDAKELTENSDPEQLDRDNTASHRHAKWAAVSELVQMMREKFPLRCIDVDAAGISRDCSHCGSDESVGDRNRQCVNCGRTEDVDDRAACNTLARGQVMLKGGALLELEAAQRDKELAAKSKLAKMQAANRTARELKKNASKNIG